MLRNSVVVVVKVTVLKLSLMNYSFTCILVNCETGDVAFVAITLSKVDVAAVEVGTAIKVGGI